MHSQETRAQVFQKLHLEPGCFVIPNPWDQGSAKLLQHLGFMALATTSAGFAFSQGRPDTESEFAATMAHIESLARAVDLPITADLGNGFGESPEAIHRAILAAAATGAVGASIEDATAQPDCPIHDIGLAVERIRAAVEAARSLPFPFMLTARADNYVYGIANLSDTIRRLQLFQEAGADVLFAPGIRQASDIAAIVGAVERPVNMMMGMAGSGLDLDTLTRLGVRRVSLGGSLARAAYGAAIRAAENIRDHGSFQYADEAISLADIQRILTSP